MSIFNPYILIAILIAIVGSYAGGRIQQRIYDAEAFQQKLDQIEIDNAKLLLKAQERSTVVVTKFIKGRDLIHETFKERVIEKVVPSETLAVANAACAIPNFAVSLWNTANQGRLPSAAEGTDGGRSAVVLSDVISAHDGEAELCLAKERKLDAWKEWAREQCQVMNGAPC